MKKVKQVLKKENGITLIEVIASVALLAIIAGPLLGTAITAFKTNSASREKTEAIALAERVMEEIKSQRVLSSVNNIRYAPAGSTSLIPFYSIESAGEGKINPEKDSSYNPDEVDNPDLELLIDQGTSGQDGIIASVELKITNTDGGEKVIKLGQDLNCRETDLYLKIFKSGARFACYFGREIPAGTNMTEFTPNKTDCIKLKVNCKNDSGDQKTNEMLKLFTYMDNEAASKLQIYVTGNDENDSGVSIINKEEGGYEINYMSTDEYNYDLPVNQLFKIIVTIKGKKGNDIYTASSYVKK